MSQAAFFVHDPVAAGSQFILAYEKHLLNILEFVNLL